MFGFKKSKTYCFHISNFDEIEKNDIEIYEKLEHGALEHYCFTAKLDSSKKVFCVYVNYEKDLFLENPNFSLEKMTNFIKSTGLIILSVDEE
ncbi:MAG: hypothetical protein WCI36_02775 [bacterium]